MANNREATIPEPITLPEDLLGEILLRLPAADVHRFRDVCRRWRGIIDSEHFIASHRQRRAPKPLFLYRRDISLGPLGRDGGLGLVRVDLQAVDVAARESHQVLRFADVPDTHMGPGNDRLGPAFPSLAAIAAIAIHHADSLFKVEGSCDGILLISYLDRLYGCNPSTGHWQSLPPIHQDGGIIGFYARDSPGGGRAYRVLYQTGARYINLSYRIRELGGEEPHAVHDIGRPTSPGTPQVLLHDLLLLAGLLPAHRAPPTMFRGSLHWLPILSRTHMITVFDTAAQEFRWINPPVVPAAAENGAFQLLEIDGRLAMAAIDAARTTIHVCVLQDYPNEAWVPGYQFKLPPAAITQDIGYNPLDHPPAFIVSQERDVLLRCPHAMLHCDAAGDVLRHYWRPHHRIIATPHMFEESLVQHAFLPRRGNDGDHGEPPFFLPHEP